MDKPEPKLCEKTGKVCYSSEKSAKAKTKCFDKKKRVYLCPECWFWHMTVHSATEKGIPFQDINKKRKKPEVEYGEDESDGRDGEGSLVSE